MEEKKGTRFKARIRKNRQIINKQINDFFDWVETRKYAATVNALKNKLKKIQSTFSQQL